MVLRLQWACVAAFAFGLASFPAWPAASDVVVSLNRLTGQDRQNALQALKNGGKLNGPYSPNDVDEIVEGMEPLRAGTLNILWDKIKGNLTGAEITQLLSRLTGSDRQNALQILVNAGRLGGPYTPNDVDAIVAGMESLRGNALNTLWNRTKGALTGSEIVQLLGNLTGSDRQSALQILVNAGRLSGPYTPGDVDAIVSGMEALRANALNMLWDRIKCDLSRVEVSQLLGHLSGADRQNAFQILKNAGRLTTAYAFSDVTAIATSASPSSTPTSASTSTSGATQTAPNRPVQASTTAVSTSPVLTDSDRCRNLTDTASKFCILLSDAAASLGIDVLSDTATDLAIRRAYLALFNTLSPKMQHALLAQFTTELVNDAYKKTVNAVLAKNLNRYLNDYLSSPAIGIFEIFIKDIFDAWNRKTYLDSGAPEWKFVVAQSVGDQIYVAIAAWLSTRKIPSPLAYELEALILETQNDYDRLQSVREYAVGLYAVDRPAAIAGLESQIRLTTDSIVDREVRGLVIAGMDNKFLARISAAVMSTDIPEFSRVAKLLLDARLAKVRFGNTENEALLVERALSEAATLDSQRPLASKLWITTFGSYRHVTDCLVEAMRLRQSHP